MLTLSIDRRHEAPVYEQVADQLRRLVASGALDPGTALPSVRQLDGDLGVNLNTIARAYRLLEEEGFLVIRDRAGVAVAATGLAVTVFDGRRYPLKECQDVDDREREEEG